MPIRLLIALIGLVVAPLLLIGWMLTNATAAQEAVARDSFVAVLRQQLDQWRTEAELLLGEYQQDLLTGLVAADDPQQWIAELRRSDPRVQSAFLLDANNKLVYPRVPAQIDARRMTEFLMIEELVNGRPRGQIDEALMLRAGDHQASWMPWYREQGLQLVIWLQRPDGTSAGILLNRPAWVARLIARLPDSKWQQASSVLSAESLARTETRISLVDAQGATVYQWGDRPSRQSLEQPAPAADRQSPSQAKSLSPEQSAQQAAQQAAQQVGSPAQRVLPAELANRQWYDWAEVNLRPPLSAWSLRYQGTVPLIAVRSQATPIMIGLAALGVLLVALGVYVMTSFRRQARLAQQQVSFAGQVSHELRTPLTNIRLYAELAQQDLAGFAEGTLQQGVRQRLVVIDQETQRLSRLCAGVLELVKRPQGNYQPRWEHAIPDQRIDDLIEQYGPALASHHCQIERLSGAGEAVWFECQTLETVFVNLLSNVEKYAVAGGWMGVTTRLEAEQLWLTVEDRGAGIPRRYRRKIFRPFFRIDSSIHVPSGTGIGLSISRQLARGAGGELRFCPVTTGARFELTLPVRRQAPGVITKGPANDSI